MINSHRPAQPYVTLFPGDELADRMELGGQTLSATWSKSIASPVGQWSVTVAPGRQGRQGDHTTLIDNPELYARVRPNNVISLGASEVGGWGLGLVSKVSRAVQAMGSGVQQTVTLSGMDLGKTLMQDSVVQASMVGPQLERVRLAVEEQLGPEHPLLAALPGEFGPRVDFGDGLGPIPTFTGVGVQDVIEWALNNVVSMRLPLFSEVTGGDGRIGEIISTDFTITDWGEAQVWSEGLSTFQGSVWAFLRATIDTDFWEMFLDYIPNNTALPQAALVVRPKPFDQEATTYLSTDDKGISWSRLRTLVDGRPFHNIEARSIAALNIGTTDEDTLAYYEVTSPNWLIGNTAGENLGLRYPAIDLYAAKRFGLRAMKSQVALVQGDLRESITTGDDAELSATQASELTRYRHALLNWHRPNPMFERGQVTVVNFDHQDRIRCGDRIRLPGVTPQRGGVAGLDAYVVGVSHRWTLGQPQVTQVQFIRGHNAEALANFNAELAASSTPNAPDGLVVADEERE